MSDSKGKKGNKNKEMLDILFDNNYIVKILDNIIIVKWSVL